MSATDQRTIREPILERTREPTRLHAPVNGGAGQRNDSNDLSQGQQFLIQIHNLESESINESANYLEKFRSLVHIISKTLVFATVYAC